VLTSVLLKQQNQSTRSREWFYRSKPDFKLNMSSIAFDVNSLPNRFRNRLVVAHPLLTYVVALTFSSRACFLLFPQQVTKCHFQIIGLRVSSGLAALTARFSEIQGDQSKA
jgi:hypothetical protein